MDTQCIKCHQGKGYVFKSSDEYINYLFNTKAEGYIEYHTNQNAVAIHRAHREGLIKRLPKWIYTRENFEKIIKDLYNKGIVSKNDLSFKYLSDVKLLIQKYDVGMTDVYTILFGEEFYCESWKYPSFSFGLIKLTPAFDSDML